MKKSVNMLNSGSSKLDEILNAGRADKTHVGLGYTGNSRGSQTTFVKASISGVKILDDLKQKASVGTPVRIPGVTQPGVSQARRPPTDSNQMRSRRRIPICHYCNKIGHIRPRCYQYFTYLRRADKERARAPRRGKQV